MIASKHKTYKLVEAFSICFESNSLFGYDLTMPIQLDKEKQLKEERIDQGYLESDDEEEANGNRSQC